MSSSEENGTRATVALVNSKVETVDAKVDGLRDIVTTGFARLETVPTAVQSLTDRMTWAETRITHLEEADDQRKGWRKVTLPQILIGVAGLAIAVTNIVVVLNVH